MDFHNLGNLVEGETVLLTAGSLLQNLDSPLYIRGMLVGSSNIDVGAPRNPFDHLFKWYKFAISMDYLDPKSVADVESEQFFEILEDLFLGHTR